MADDMGDVPPLEDMTDVLRQADAIREKRDAVPDLGKKSNREKAKERAKVNKKSVTGHAVKPQHLEAGDSNLSTQNSLASQISSQAPVPTEKPQPTPPKKGDSVKKNTTQSDKGGLFGGLKKGFLFGGSNQTKSSGSPVPPPAKSNQSVKPPSSVSVSAKKETSRSKGKDDIPYIKANGKTETGLTLDEVQQAMSETKGLLDNQDWITDDLLNKVEGNELLLKRFADPTFMKALEEFQTNPEAAMAKYKDNTEVEKFLLEFCGLMGDHFTKLGSSSSPQSTQKASPTSQQSTKTSETAQTLAAAPKPSTHGQSQGPKIVELIDDNSSSTAEKVSKQYQPKIVEIDDSKSVSPDMTVLNISGKSSDSRKNSPNIVMRNPAQGADMTEVPAAGDEEVKKMLDDPKVMEILMDPQIMSLIQQLRSDPAKAQRTIDNCDVHLKEKVRFLVSKGLLQFQAG